MTDDQIDYPPAPATINELFPDAEQGNLALLLEALRNGRGYYLDRAIDTRTGETCSVISVITALVSDDPHVREQLVDAFPEAIPVAVLLGDIDDVVTRFDWLEIPTGQLGPDLQP